MTHGFALELWAGQAAVDGYCKFWDYVMLPAGKAVISQRLPAKKVHNSISPIHIRGFPKPCQLKKHYNLILYLCLKTCVIFTRFICSSK
jgi:hypothetical protein